MTISCYLRNVTVPYQLNLIIFFIRKSVIYVVATNEINQRQNSPGLTWWRYYSMHISRQGSLCNINIKQVLMAEWKNILFFTNFLIRAQMIGKWKNYIDNDAATVFLGAIFVRKMTLYFYRKMSVFETSKYLFIVRFWSSITKKRIFIRNSNENGQNN